MRRPQGAELMSTYKHPELRAWGGERDGAVSSMQGPGNGDVFTVQWGRRGNGCAEGVCGKVPEMPWKGRNHLPQM